MPELPEVETVRRGLAAHVLGRVVTRAKVLRDRSVRRHAGGPADLEARLVGRGLVAAVRRGKYLWLLLSESMEGVPTPAALDDDALMVHLGMSGQLLVGGAPDGPHVRVRLHLDDGGLLTFVDQRTFGHVLLSPLVPTADGGPGGLGADLPLLPRDAAHIARDLVDAALGPGSPGRVALVDRIRSRHTGIKRALLDQTTVSGVGNIYADEGLWRAGVHCARGTAGMSRAQVGAVLDGVEAVMRAALVAGGTSFDRLYVNVNGASGYFDRSLAVYGQDGRPCRRCGAIVVREAFMNRSSYRCPRCQPVPRRPHI